MQTQVGYRDSTVHEEKRRELATGFIHGHPVICMVDEATFLCCFIYLDSVH